MQLQRGHHLYSATDLVAFLECEHLTTLDLQHLVTPMQKTADDEAAELIARKGDEHERAYLAALRSEGRQVVDIAADGGSVDEKVLRTLQAMRDGTQVIYQATLRDGAFFGHADFLCRVERASALGAWSYEVADTKLARQPKAKFVVQLAFYSHLLECAQGIAPLQMRVVLGDRSERGFRCADYMHYFRALLARFVERVGANGAQAPATYPVPCAHCDLCHWRERCEAKREADDHLCRVANITRVQTARLQDAGVTTLERLGALPVGAQVQRMQPETLVRLRSQASLQAHARRTGERCVEVLPLDAARRRGFYRLPVPDDGDLYFDMESDLLEDDGLEYLFGVWFREGGDWRFRAFWAHDRAEERVAFEQFTDFVVERRRRHRGAHVYHYASYEETALKRLALLHATREVDVDNLLRQGALVDLYKVVREGIRISEPSYSIKSVERFYRSAREGEVQTAAASIVYYERWRETGDAQLLQDIEHYNRDDVLSTQQLRDWLLTLRPAGLPWATHEVIALGETETALTKAEGRLVPYRGMLVDTLPADRAAWSGEHRMAELTYQLLDFHRRADKPAWWAMFARMDLTEDELIDDPECLGGLQLDEAIPPFADKKSTIYTFIVPEQETKLGDGSECTRADTGQALGKLALDESARRARVRVGPTKEALPARVSLGPGKPIDSDVIAGALYRFADSVIEGDGCYAAVRSVLRRDIPALRGRASGEPIVPAGVDVLQGAIDAVRAMDETHLFIQGPPGAGKTYTGSRLVVDLLRRGQRVGITSHSHKAINNLLKCVVEVALAEGVDFRGCKKCSKDEASAFEGRLIDNVDKNEAVFGGGYQLMAGTAWLFADPCADQLLDCLFVDEAGQVALANLVAMGTSARNIVLLGDQMQLGQPIQGVHPGRSGESSLEYLLDGAATIAPDRGIFLATTWRMHPDICRFISDAVYDGRLEPEATNVRRQLVLAADAHRLLRPSGIVHEPIEHSGCSQRSEQEAVLVREVLASALRQHYTDRRGVRHAMTLDNILVVAPYNMQVNLLKSVLPAGARVGTVDKFQGQEAELLIVSMTTSSEQDLPRHIEFLYSKNRLNVAISRAKCLAIVIASPALMAIKCSTPEQMALVNTLCWVAEVGGSRSYA